MCYIFPASCLFLIDAQKQAALARAKKAAPKVQPKASASKGANPANNSSKKNKNAPNSKAIVIVKPKGGAAPVKPGVSRPKVNLSQQQQLQQQKGGKQPAQQTPAAPAKKSAANKPASQTSTPILSIKTAEAIARDSSHPRRNEVAELLKTYERGWIDSNKFHSLLQKMIV
jgi:hypothetical protein